MNKSYICDKFRELATISFNTSTEKGHQQARNTSLFLRWGLFRSLLKKFDVVPYSIFLCSRALGYCKCSLATEISHSYRADMEQPFFAIMLWQSIPTRLTLWRYASKQTCSGCFDNTSVILILDLPSSQPWRIRSQLREYWTRRGLRAFVALHPLPQKWLIQEWAKLSAQFFFELDEPALRNTELTSRRSKASGHTESK